MYIDVELLYRDASPEDRVWKALETICNSTPRLKGLEDVLNVRFEDAKGLLKKMGASFLVIVETPFNSKKNDGLLPLRVTDHNIIHTRFGNSRTMASWKNNQIIDLSLRFCNEIQNIVRKIVEHIQIIVHRLKRRFERKAYKRHCREYKLRYKRIHAALSCH